MASFFCLKIIFFRSGIAIPEKRRNFMYIKKLPSWNHIFITHMTGRWSENP